VNKGGKGEEIGKQNQREESGGKKKDHLVRANAKKAIDRGFT